MERKAITCYQEIEEIEIITSWKVFVTARQICFGTSSYDDPMEALINIKQTSTMKVYKTQFKLLSNRVRESSESCKLNCFLGKLKEEIRMGAHMLNPQNLVAIYRFARI